MKRKYAHETQFMQIPQNGDIGQQRCLQWCSQESSLRVEGKIFSINYCSSDGQLTRLVDYSVFIITFTFLGQILATNMRYKRTRMAFSRD